MKNSFHNLRDKWKQRDGPEVSRVSFEIILYKDLIFATLHSFEKKGSLMERSQILAIGVQSVFEPSLRNLPARLSISVALLVLNSFNVFKIGTKLTYVDFLLEVVHVLVDVAGVFYFCFCRSF